MGHEFDTLNRLLADLKQNHLGLSSLLPRDKWEEIKGEGDKQKKVIGVLAYLVSTQIDAIRELIDDIHLSGGPLLTQTSQAKYFEKEILPFENEIRELWLKALGLDDFGMNLEADDELDSMGDKQKEEWVFINRIDSLIPWAIESNEDCVEGGRSLSDVTVDEQTYKKAIKLVRSNFFQPDKWYLNLQKLEPILVATQKVPKIVRSRLREINDSFIVGHYLSVAVLCRSVLEYALFDRAAKYEIDSLHPGQSRKSLSDLINEFSRVLPSIEIQMRLISRLAGNSIHLVPATETNVRQLPSVHFADAYKCRSAIKAVLEEIYV